jgi:hypothetical protein
MANSYAEYTSLSGTTYAVPSNFLSIDDIIVKGYNGSTWTTLTINQRDASAKTVTLSSAPSSYQKIRVYRMTSSSPLVDFASGATLTASDLDTSYQQGLLLSQEVAEDADPEGGSGIGNIVSSQLADVSITNSNLAGGITNDKLASGVGTSANNLVKLDANAKLPAVDGSQLTNVGGGKMLQFKLAKEDSGTAQRTTTNTNFVSSGLFVQITPSSASSKILISFGFTGLNGNGNAYVQANVYRNITSSTNHDTQIAGGTSLSGSSALQQYGMATLYTGGTGSGVLTSMALDSPNSTSQLTYTLAYSANGNGGTAIFGWNGGYRYISATEIEE